MFAPAPNVAKVEGMWGNTLLTSSDVQQAKDQPYKSPAKPSPLLLLGHGTQDHTETPIRAQKTGQLMTPMLARRVSLTPQSLSYCC